MIDDCSPAGNIHVDSGDMYESLFPVVLSMSSKAGDLINFCELCLEYSGKLSVGDTSYSSVKKNLIFKKLMQLYITFVLFI